MHASGPAVKIVQAVEPLINGSNSMMCPAVMTVSSYDELHLSSNLTLLSHLSVFTVLGS